MRDFIFILAVVFTVSCTPKVPSKENSAPKLVIGIVVDQMRYDYLLRFKDRFEKDGFNRLLDGGFSCNTHYYSYVPTFTAPGHASIFTGTTPKNHGIIANSWYDRELDRSVYCVEDTSVRSVEGDFENGRKSPKNLLVNGLGDLIKLNTNNKGKSIGVSLKDRGAVLPAGKSADAAYWFEGGDTGIFISSTYYMDTLPQWVNTFNEKQYPKKFLSNKWDTYQPIETYIESNADDNPYENGIGIDGGSVFPYELADIFKTQGYDLIKSTPYGNDLLASFAQRVILNEELGKDDVTDFISISFSSTDYVGHAYGPRSVEVEDTYIRLDRLLLNCYFFWIMKLVKMNMLFFLLPIMV